MTISIALIVKNEEKTLDRCLASLAGAVDEIVVVDTGSTDATKSVASRYTDRIFDFAWCDDFAAARQAAFDWATGDWVGWVDADDVVMGAEHIRRQAAEAAAGVGAIYWRYALEVDPAGQPQCQFWRERLVRNDASWRWQSRIHEVLVTDRPWKTVRKSDVWIEHHSPPDRDQRRLQRNIALMQAELAEGGDQPEPRLLFYLARDLHSAGRFEEALAAYQRYLRVAIWDDERYLAQVALAGLLRTLGRLDESADADLHAMLLKPRWPDAYFGLAQTSYFLRKWEDVVHWCDIGRGLPAPATDHILNLAAYQHQWIIYYTNALYHLSRPLEALAWTERALSMQPEDPWHRQNVAFFGELVTGKR